MVRRIVHRVARHAHRKDVGGRRATRHVERTRGNGVLDHHGQADVRPTGRIRTRIRVGDRIGDVAPRPRHDRIGRFRDGQQRGAAGQGLARRAVVAVELLVVEARGHFLVRRQGADAARPDGDELVHHVAHRPAVVGGDLREVELVFGDDDLLGAVVELHDHHDVGADQAEAGGIEQVRIAHGLEPRVAVRHQVAVVVEAVADIAQVVPDAFGAQDRAGFGGRRGVRPERRVLLQQVLVFLRHLVGAVGPDLVGHGGNFVAAGQRAGIVGLEIGAAVPGRGPDVVFQPQVVFGLHAVAPDRVAVGVELRIADQPVHGDAFARLDRADVARRVGGPHRAAFVGQRELPARQRADQSRMRPARIGPRRPGVQIADVGPDVRQRLGAIVAEFRPDVGRFRRIGGRRLRVGIDHQVVGRDDLDPQIAVRVPSPCRRRPRQRRADGGKTYPPPKSRCGPFFHATRASR